MESEVKVFLKDAGVADFQQGFEELGLLRLQDLAEILPTDLDHLGIKPVQRRRFERHLKEWQEGHAYYVKGGTISRTEEGFKVTREEEVTDDQIQGQPD